MQSDLCWWMFHVCLKTMSILWLWINPSLKNQLHLLMDGACFFLLHLFADRVVVQPAAASAAGSSLCKSHVLCFTFLLGCMWLSTHMLLTVTCSEKICPFSINASPFFIHNNFTFFWSFLCLKLILVTTALFWLLSANIKQTFYTTHFPPF